MAPEQVSSLLDPIRRLVGGEGGCALSDAELLEKFVASADATAFEVLVWRHGAMVLGLCCRILRDRHEAEDAFQATFLVFARKAGSIGQREAVGCWLYKVAYRIALRLRASIARRPATGESTEELPAPEQVDDADWRDLRPVLDEEIARLPGKYRAAFVLCYLEGRTNEEAAVQLGCPKGTILSRLSRGREWLRTRLMRRGIALTAAGLASTLSKNTLTAAVPTALTRSTINAAVPFAAGKAATELVSTTVAALSDGVLRAMILTKIKVAGMALLSLAAISTGITWAARGGGPGVSSVATESVAIVPFAKIIDQSAAIQMPEPLEDNDVLDDDRGPTPINQPERNRGNQDSITDGKIVAIAKDGKSFTIEVPAKNRGEAPSKHTIKLTDKTAIIYISVLENGAKLTEGYHARVKLENGSTDIAETATLDNGEVVRGGADLSGEIAGFTKESITIIDAGPKRERGVEPKRQTIPFDSKTVIDFGNVSAGQAKITEGYLAWVWLTGDGKSAAKIRMLGQAGDVGRRDEKRPDLYGKVVSVSPNGKQFTVTTAIRRGAGNATREVTIGDKTQVIYSQVQVDGTKPTEGYQANVWYAEGSQDTAAKVVFIGTAHDGWEFITGRVKEVSEKDKDGMTIEIELPGDREGLGQKRTKIKIPASAKVFFSQVGPNEAKATVGLEVQVRLKENSTDTAAQAVFFKLAKQNSGGSR
jgi:RNA polymerase sigma factor (sigma-70 family)